MRCPAAMGRGLAVAVAVLPLLLAGCGSSTQQTPTGASGKPATRSSTTSLKMAHPQAVEPVAGAVGASAAGADPTPSATSTSTADPSPTAPATISSGAARDAPTDAAVRAESARFQQLVARYHLNRLNFSGVLLDPAELPPGPYSISIASVETLYGHRDACGGILRPWALGVANKTLPCGTQVVFLYHGRAVRVPVVDRGPYVKGRDWDLSGATAEALHFPGLGPVQWRLG